KSIAWLKGVSIKVYIGLYSLLALTLVIGIARLAISAPGLASLAPVLGLAAFLLIGGGIWLGRTICKPIMAALKTVRQIAEGNFSDWLNTDRTDELGELLMNIISTQIRLGFAHNDLRRRTWETERVQQALNTVNTSVMIADAELNIIFMNDAVKALFTAAEEDIRSDLPNFDASTLLGSNIDQFHKNPAHQRGLLSGLSKTFTTDISLGGISLRITANPVISEQGEQIGTVVEWLDRTKELAVEQEIGAIIDASQAGDLSQRIAMQGKTGFFETISRSVNRLVEVSDHVITDTARVLNAMAAGDLTQKIDAEYQGAFRELKEGINTLGEKFTGVVGKIANGAGEVLGGAREIAAGNIDLSQRTEEQAASLEETASSMEEMTSTVRQNADNAHQADQLSKEAREQAARGGAVVTQAITAMEEISTSSKKIAEIIEVINDIAFQTNLLALNAAVEAARAGEQGRGFAVVASEVRNLAQRSATASKDIKDLIEDSVAKVGEGSELVHKSGETLEEINTSVKKVSDIIAEIAAASHEQSAGIEQINKAITQMDQMTQQNAALVEQAAAASESVGDQAEGLNKLISFFSVKGVGEHASQPGVERRSAERPWQKPSATKILPEAEPAPQSENLVPLSKAVSVDDDDEWEEF
ncbi:MAG: hypothetical protein DRQ60_03450, partial [Gammaproteobacteria bacterium]